MVDHFNNLFLFMLKEMGTLNILSSRSLSSTIRWIFVSMSLHKSSFNPSEGVNIKHTEKGNPLPELWAVSRCNWECGGPCLRAPRLQRSRTVLITHCPAHIFPADQGREPTTFGSQAATLASKSQLHFFLLCFTLVQTLKERTFGLGHNTHTCWPFSSFWELN